MMHTFDQYTTQLIDLLTVEQLDQYLFRGKSLNIFGSRIYGGQLLGQSVMIASQLCRDHLHSLHACFIYAGDATQPVMYHVTALQQGRSFSRFSINAKQNDQIIFTAMLSFAKHEDGVIYQPDPPEYIFNKHLKTEQTYRESVAHCLPEKLQSLFTQNFHIDIRPLDFIDPTAPSPVSPQYAEYLKTYSTLPAHLPHGIHAAIVAYYSDYSLMNSTLRPHGISYLSAHLQSASLDHSLYFHLPVQADEWMLYDITATITAQARGLNIGQMWQNGQLVCTALQENLIRIRNS